MISVFIAIVLALSDLPRYQSIERRQIQLPANCWEAIQPCPIGSTFNRQNCTCELTGEQLAGGGGGGGAALATTVIRREYRPATQSVTRNCGDGRIWIGSGCVSSVVLCPGGYQWNGSVCATAEQITRIRVAVPTSRDGKAGAPAAASTYEATQASKYAATGSAVGTTVATAHVDGEMAGEMLPLDLSDEFGASMESNIPESPSSATDLTEPPAPTYTTSPFCSFGYIWTNGGCRKASPNCPIGFDLVQEKCVRQAPQRTDDLHGPNKWQKRSVALWSSAKLSEMAAQQSNMSVDQSGKAVGPLKVDVGEPKCCTVFSPRYCRQVEPHMKNKWQCFHQKVKGCGNICLKPEVYLRASSQKWTGSLLVMPPPSRRVADILRFGNRITGDVKIGRLRFSVVLNELRAGPELWSSLAAIVFLFTFIPLFYCNAFVGRWANLMPQLTTLFPDCSGCTDGSRRCSRECFLYDCDPLSCLFVDEATFCRGPLEQVIGDPYDAYEFRPLSGNINICNLTKRINKSWFFCTKIAGQSILFEFPWKITLFSRFTLFLLFFSKTLPNSGCLPILNTYLSKNWRFLVQFFVHRKSHWRRMETKIPEKLDIERIDCRAQPYSVPRMYMLHTSWCTF